MKTLRPWIIYGTAWKKNRTTELVEAALREGFLAIDTANQPKHYDEQLVGDAVRRSKIPRESLFLQTKFTPVDGQDSRLPYHPDSPLKTQVADSFRSSLEHLQTDYLDSYLLHGPYNYPDLGDEDWDVWEAIEDLHLSGGARRIGISNVNARQLQALIERAKIKPMVVQNRCFAKTGWDMVVRDLCTTHQIMYQGFSLLTANPHVFEHTDVQTMAEARGVAPAQIIFRFALQVGMTPLTGTTDASHMRADLRIRDFELTPNELEFIENIDYRR